MSTKHTPGPWKKGDGQHSYRVFAIGNGNGEVAQCHGKTNAEAEANARLIAAAPELLEAIKNLVERTVRDAETYAPKGNEPIWAFIQDAADAIAKATTNPDNIDTGEPDPCDLARDYQEAQEYGNQPTPYDP